MYKVRTYTYTVSYMDIHTLIDLYMQYMQPIQVGGMERNQISDIRPPKKSNIRSP